MLQRTVKTLTYTTLATVFSVTLIGTSVATAAPADAGTKATTTTKKNSKKKDTKPAPVTPVVTPEATPWSPMPEANDQPGLAPTKPVITDLKIVLDPVTEPVVDVPVDEAVVDVDTVISDADTAVNNSIWFPKPQNGDSQYTYTNKYGITDYHAVFGHLVAPGIIVTGPVAPPVPSV